jgi:zinc/manganese transport system ATP-binding protein
MKNEMIQLHDLTVGYDRHPAIHHLSLDIPKSGLVAIAGPNGAGKSTLLKSIAGLLPPMHGTITGIRSMRVAYLAQVHEIDRSFPVSVLDMVGLGLWHELGFFGGQKQAHRDKISQALYTVGLDGFEHRPIATLSGGQFQRALFARMILQDADLLLLDEPFSSIDSASAQLLLTITQDWSHQGKTVLAVLHDHAQIKTYFPLCALLARDLIAFGPPAEALSLDNLQRAQQTTLSINEDADLCQRSPTNIQPFSPETKFIT